MPIDAAQPIKDTQPTEGKTHAQISACNSCRSDQAAFKDQLLVLLYPDQQGLDNKMAQPLHLFF